MYYTILCASYIYAYILTYRGAVTGQGHVSDSGTITVSVYVWYLSLYLLYIACN